MRVVPLLVLLAACNDQTVSKFREPPVVAIETPADGSSVDEGVSVAMQGRVIDDAYQDDLPALTVLWAVDGGTV